ncbi:sugar phosphate isomerase/epimerase family protein [Allosphingosinicella deserti]|uniref:sugar phosphate isomerase/epimerase family protein n=1 Tax=Allosphingosinicella deserti TaxID=2116704 RepID=UPI0013047F6C|nr:sugar phosphate isomerase/epimerase [Sphingomonas deserti]
MITRRSLIAQSGILAAGAMLPGAAWAAPARSSRMPPLGVQLWTVKDDLAKDFTGTLRQLYRLGYRRIEAAGWYDRTPKQFRDAMRAAGLECVSAHHSMSDLIDHADERLAFARDVGVKYVVASSPATAKKIDDSKGWNQGVADAMTLDHWRYNAEQMDRIGKKARALGLRFGYHNHAAEFLTYDRKLPMEEILRLTDPAHLVLELDLGWAAAAGYDPADAIRRFAPRTHLLHVKDIVAGERVPGKIAADARSTVVGEGSIDWKSVFAAARSAPIYSYFVEQEDPFTEPPLQALAKSAAYLRQFQA